MLEQIELAARQHNAVGARGNQEEQDGEEESARKVNPLVRVASDLATQLSRLEQQFGLTPAARASLKVEPQKPEGKLAGYRTRTG